VSAKPIIPREAANRDIEQAVDYYSSAAGEQAALGFIDALEGGFRHIASHPATGSPRYGQELDLAGLRVWPLKRYPYLVFYVERDSHIDLWRVLLAKRDIPASMQVDPWS
jgi:toxin ParE1/3/4